MTDSESSPIKIKNGLSYKKNGWTYVSIKGSPKDRGYAYGYLIAKEFKKVQEMLNYNVYNDFGKTWDFFIEAGKTALKETIITHFPEIYEEMEGIAKGCSANGTKTSVDEILAWNNYFTLLDSHVISYPSLAQVMEKH